MPRLIAIIELVDTRLQRLLPTCNLIPAALPQAYMMPRACALNRMIPLAGALHNFAQLIVRECIDAMTISARHRVVVHQRVHDCRIATALQENNKCAQVWRCLHQTAQ